MYSFNITTKQIQTLKMKKIIFPLFVFAVIFPAFSQGNLPKDLTVSDVYQQYEEAIGGKEKIETIANKMDASSITTTFKTSGIVSNEGSSKQEVINFWDYGSVQSAVLTKQYPSSLSEEIAISRYFTANGTTTMHFANGQKQEMATLANTYQQKPFPEITVPDGAELIAQENLDGRAVNVVRYETSTMGVAFSHLVYFDSNSGLMVRSEQRNEQETAGSKIVTSTENEYSDYREVDGLRIAHKITTTILSKTTGTMEMETNTVMTIQVHWVDFNIDPMDFKQNCFQQPEACFQAYF